MFLIGLFSAWKLFFCIVVKQTPMACNVLVLIGLLASEAKVLIGIFHGVKRLRPSFLLANATPKVILRAALSLKSLLAGAECIARPRKH
jgi:hypothetical protein